MSDLDNVKNIQHDAVHETFFINDEKPSLLKIDFQKDLLKMVDLKSLEEK